MIFPTPKKKTIEKPNNTLFDPKQLPNQHNSNLMNQLALGNIISLGGSYCQSFKPRGTSKSCQKLKKNTTWQPTTLRLNDLSNTRRKLTILLLLTHLQTNLIKYSLTSEDLLPEELLTHSVHRAIYNKRTVITRQLFAQVTHIVR